MKKDFQNKALIYRVFAVLCLIIISQTVHAQVSGSVFRDYNSNGIIDTTASYREIGQIGVIVKAFNSLSAEVGTSTTDKNGNYFITGVSGPLRIEFSNLPNLDFSSFSGGTSVQFVNGGATNVNFGINYPSDYCEKDPYVATTCFVVGDPTAVGYPTNGGPNDALVSTKYSFSSSTINHDAKYSQIGSTWGVSYNRLTKKMFTAAFVKRHAGLGSLGIGGIYVTDYAAGNPATIPPTTTNLIDLVAEGINVGTIPSNSMRGLQNASNVTSMDSAGWYGVGKIGLGDIDISDDYNSLFTVNLNTKSVIKIDITNFNKTGVKPTATNISTLPDYPNANCSNGQSRPFALKYRKGKIYLGVICDASSGGTITDLKAIVYAFDEATSTWSVAVPAFPLDFRRGPVHRTSCEYWIPWTDDVTKVVTSQGPAFNGRCFPQPILSDIEFDVDGSMILGFADRGAHMMGSFQPLIDDKNLLINGVNGGDILRVYNNNGTYILESGGTTLGGGGAGLNNEGPGGGEYYRDNFPNHFNTSLGGLALLAGTNEVLTSTIDPVRVQGAGFRVNGNATGEVNRVFELYYSPSASGTFNKGAGLGDVELLCDVPPIQVGNRIWIDEDKDGIQDAGELALPNIKVALYDSTGTKISEVTSNALGEYYFDTLNIVGGKLLALSRYEIRIAKTAINDTLKLTESNTGTSDLLDSDADLVGANYVIPVLTGNYGENSHTYDFGFAPELPDLKVTKTSDKSIVKKGQNVKFTVTIKNEGKGKATSVKLEDLIPSGATLINSTTTSTTSTNAGSYNAGIWSIDSLVAKDSVILVIEITANQEGVLSNVAQIKSMNEKDVDSTPGNSEYREDDIATACYTVPYEFCKADKPTFTLSAPDSLITINWFRNGVELTAETGKKNIIVSDSGSYYYQGIMPTTLCNAESCCPVILVPYKIAVAGNDSTVCASDGILQLKAAPAGTSWSASTGNPSPATVESSTGLISGLINPGIYQFIIKGDTCCADTIKITKIDCFGSIGDYVWFDKNQNGIQDSGEVPVKGMKIILYAADGTTKLDSTFTDISGKYLFDSLRTNNYYVKFVAPKDSALTGNLAGTNKAIDSNANPLTGLSDRVSIDTALPVGDPGRDNKDVDAGLIPIFGSIGDFVWFDKNANGQQDPTEVPVKGIKVILYKENALGVFVKVDSVITNNVVGNYLFDSLATGSYKVQFIAPKDSAITLQNSGSNSTIDSNADPLTGLTGIIGIDVSKPSGDIARNNRSIDVGIIPAYGSIGDYVWTDKNNDGQQTAGELPIAGVKVILYAGDGTTKLDSTVTNAAGKYLFDSLLTGSYKVKFVAPAETIPAKSNVGSDLSDSDANKLGFSQVININTALLATDTLRNNPQIDAGFVPVGSIGDYVFLDKDNSGTQTAGDTPVAGVKVYLLDNAGNKIDSTTTDGTGKYLFINVPSGTYSVQFIASGGSTFVTPNNGDDNLDSDAGVDGKTSPITIDATQPIGSPARDNRSIAAGINQPVIYGSIGDYVWFDANKDGLQTSGEAPVKGVKVYLLNATGTIIDSTKTDVNGKYLFDSLITGSYKIRFVAPKDSNLTVKGTNPLSAIDSNPDTTTGLTDAVLIDTTKPAGDPGRDNRDVDAGITINLGSIAGKIFDDNDKSGTQNAGDVDRSMVKVYLYKEIGGVYVKVDSVITDSQGNYKFNNLMTANYQVQFSKPTGTTFTNSNVGNDTLDSDASLVDGKTGIISINTNLPETDLSRNSKYNDAGFILVPADCKTDICVPFTTMKAPK